MNYSIPFATVQEALPNPGQYAYRYIDRTQGHSKFDYWGEPCGISHYTTHIELQKWYVVGFTPKGFYIEYGYGHQSKKWISHNWRKKFAHLNLSDAQKSFKKRKEVQKNKLMQQLKTCETVLRAIKKDQWEDQIHFTKGVIK